MTARDDTSPEGRRRFRIPGPWNHSLQARLVAYFLLLAGLTVSVVAVVVYQRATEDLSRSAFERLEAVADLKQDALDRWVDEQRRNVVLIASLPSTVASAATALDDPPPALVPAEDGAGDLIRRILGTAERQTADAQEFLILDGAGRVRLSTRTASEGADQSTQPYFRQGLQGPAVQNAYTSALTGTPTITVSAPLLDADGGGLGVLAANLDLERIDEIVLGGTGLGSAGATYLVGPDGRFVHAALDGGTVLGSEGISEALAGRAGQGIYDDYRGEPVIGIYRWLESHDAALIVEQSQSEAFASAQELALIIAIVGLVSAILLGSGVWIIARQVTRPLQRLAAAASTVSDGDLEVTTPVTSEDEVGQLTVAFNEMTAQLRENVENLERRVQARTAELSSALEGQAEAEERYRHLVEELPMAVYTEGPDGDAASFYMSQRVENLFGYPAQSWSDPGFRASVMNPQDRDRALAELAPENADEQGRTAATYRLFASDRATYWVNEQRWIVRDARGSALHVQGLISDVTTRTLEQAELRRQKTYLESLVEASPVAVITTIGADDLVVAWNPGATRLFGWTADEAVGRTIDDLVAGVGALDEDGQSVSQEASATGRASRMTRRTRKDGTYVDVEILVVPLVVDGEEIASLAIYHDITELVAARKVADAANEAKSTFLAAMSHEIRTPMNAIIGMSGLLADSRLSHEQHDFVETIQTSGDALLTIINDILDFSKIEAGRVDLIAEPFSLRHCLEGALDVLAATAAGKGIELAYDIDAGLPRAVVGDEGRLRQIVLNLLSNAVKFTERGEVVMRAFGSTSAGTGGRWSLVVQVHDTGIGIPPERMDRLFQSFSQADASISRRFGGTGLGLAISHRLAQLMDGSLVVESTGVEGEGSTFTLTVQLPAAEDAGDDEVLSGADTDLAGRRVLIVDDNATNRRILAAQVSRWGMAARDVGSSVEALGLVEEGSQLDLVLSDLHMPELDGLGLADAIHHARPGVPVVILSSVGHREGRSPDIAAYLTKPVKPSALHDAIQTVLSGTRAAAGSPAPTSAALDPEMAARHPLRILVAEDNLVNQKLALKLLERMGFAAEVVGDGAAAVAAVAAATFDVVLMDVQMPELDGMEATRRIIAEHPLQRPRIVAMTANAMDEDREACFAAGMDDYLSKPIRVEVLVEALRRVPIAGMGE